MSTAFVLSGGGSLGAVQVGMLQALGARGVRPDLLIGTSVGAVNAAWVADHGMSPVSLDGLARIWSRLHRRDVFDVDAVRAVRTLTGRTPSLCSGRSLRTLVAGYAGITTLEEASVPTFVVATDLLSGEEVPISSGDPVQAVLASAAIPGVFPPVEIDGRHLVDGGVAHHTAVSRAVELGADEIYVLPAGYPCALPKPPASALGIAVQALTLLIEQRLIDEVSRYSAAATVRVLPPLCPLAISAADFSRGAYLVERGRRATTEWLDEGGVDLPDQARFLGLHRHRERASDGDEPSTAARPAAQG